MIKNDRREMGFVGNVHATSSIMDRFLGYYRALLLHGLSLRGEWTIRDCDSRNNLIRLELPEELPTAFVCDCDVVANKLISALREQGLWVPEDIFVTGFDDFTETAPVNVPLSAFRADTDSMIELMVKPSWNAAPVLGNPLAGWWSAASLSTANLKNRWSIMQ